jgi:hypothetical protein
MILIQIATALAIGAYVVLSKDAHPKRPNATPPESFQHPPATVSTDSVLGISSVETAQMFCERTATSANCPASIVLIDLAHRPDHCGKIHIIGAVLGT